MAATPFAIALAAVGARAADPPKPGDPEPAWTKDPPRSSVPPATEPLPALRRYAAAVAALRAAHVRVERLRPDGSLWPEGDRATIALARPDKLAVVQSWGGAPADFEVCDGKHVTRWDAAGTFVYRDPAPRTIDGVVADVRRGSAAFWGTAMLTTPGFLTSLRHAHEVGEETVDGVVARKITGRAVELDGEPTLPEPGFAVWLSKATDLPVRLLVERPQRPILLRIVYDPGAPDASAFVAAPPAHVTARPSPLRHEEFPAIAPGTPAPGFTLETVDGQKVRLADRRGKVVIVEFWAPWCPGCRASAPMIGKLVGELGAQGLDVVRVSTTADRALLAKWVTNHHEPGATVHDPGDEKTSVGFRDYRITGFPSFVVVDRDGRVAWTWKWYDAETEVRLRKALLRLGLPLTRS